MNQLNLSYSAIDTYLRCPRLYEWRYINKIPTRTNAFFLLGGAYHKAIEVGFKHKKEKGIFLPMQDTLDVFNEAWEKKEEVEDQEEAIQEIDWADESEGAMKDDGYNLVRMYAQEQAPKIKPLEVEIKVERPYQYGMFRGRIDLIPDKDKLSFKPTSVDPNLIPIIDHKTTKRRKNEDEIKHSLQSYSYAFILDKPVTMTWHVAVRKKVPEVQTDLKVTRGPEHVSWFENEILIPVADAINKGVFPARPGKFSCWGCNYQALCNPWVEAD